MFSASTLEHNR